MRKTSVFVLLWATSLLAVAQDGEPIRSLSATYYAQSLERAAVSLMANNIVSASQQVEYRAGKSVLLTPGFEAKAGAVFTAHTGVVKHVSLEGEGALLSLRGYPNPFVERANISYKLANDGITSLFITSSDGKIVGRLIDNKFQSAGQYDVEWQAGQLPSGSYLCILETSGKRIASRIIRK